MSEITREDALAEFYPCLGKDGLVSEAAFTRNGEIRDFQAFQVRFNADVWIHRHGVESTSVSPPACPVCTTRNYSRSFKLQVEDGVEVDDTVEFLQLTGIPYDDTRFTSPVEGTHSVSECSNCTGRGTFTCELCGGDGVEECYNCDGAGQLETPKPCPTCDGEQRYCDYCEGGGEVYVLTECRDCNGTRTQSCLKCHGDGQIQCKQCAQNGSIHSYDAHIRLMEVSWRGQGFPPEWGSDTDVISETVEGLGFNDDSFTVILQNTAEGKISTPTFEAAILKLSYGANEYLGLVVQTPSETRFIFDPHRGAIETSLQRKAADMFGRIQIWK